MKHRHGKLGDVFRLVCTVVTLAILLLWVEGAPAGAASPPTPLLEKGHSVDWWFVFKFNTRSFPACSRGAEPHCIFGGEVQKYRQGSSQQYVFASSENPLLQEGSGCAGDTTTDPLGATFDEVYNGTFFYVIWNDQFYQDPPIASCPGNSCVGPWGHSKGMLAWNEAGEGIVMQVTTPSWPAAGSRESPRETDGNTLGCIKDDDVLVSQHFFALKLTKNDLVKVLKALGNASVVTDITNAQIVKNGGPQDVQNLVARLGTKSPSDTATADTLSSGIELISKPSRLHVPPWQMVSSLLNGVPLRVASWWANPRIYSTTRADVITCWDESLREPGPVEIATSGHWSGKEFGLEGGPGPNFNHAKIGVSLSGEHTYSVFGDLNQQGSPSGDNCGSSQNGRGGLFYVLDNPGLFNGVSALISGDTGPSAPLTR